MAAVCFEEAVAPQHAAPLDCCAVFWTKRTAASRLKLERPCDVVSGALLVSMAALADGRPGLPVL
eukprot:12926583-Prorocentrum_lima.AAC.1